MSTQATHRSLGEPSLTLLTTGTGDHHRIPPTWVMLVIALPTLMTSLNSLVVTVALPQIHRDLEASVTELQWLVDAYALTYATLILPTAALGDRIEHRKLFLWVAFLFASASALATPASTPLTLIDARVVQNASGAAIGSLSLALLADAVPPHLRELAIGVWGSVNDLGVAAGSITEGTVVEDLHWNFIFWINLPVGALSLSLGWWGLRNVAIIDRSEARSTDFVGLAMTVTFVFPLTWTLMEGNSRDWTSPLVLGCLALALASLAGSIWRECTAHSAFVPAHLFRDRSSDLVNTVAMLFSIGIFGSVFLVSQYLQIGMGLGPLESGLCVASWTMAPMVVVPVAGVLAKRYGPRAMLLIGMVLQTAVVGCFVLLAHTSSGYGPYVLPMLIVSTDVGPTFSPSATAALEGIASQDRAIVSGVNQTARQLGTAIGIALCTALFTTFGAYAPGERFTTGLVPALGAYTVLLVAITALVIAIPRGRLQPAGQ